MLSGNIPSLNWAKIDGVLYLRVGFYRENFGWLLVEICNVNNTSLNYSDTMVRNSQKLQINTKSQLVVNLLVVPYISL